MFRSLYTLTQLIYTLKYCIHPLSHQYIKVNIPNPSTLVISTRTLFPFEQWASTLRILHRYQDINNLLFMVVWWIWNWGLDCPPTYEPKKKVMYLYNMFARSNFTSLDLYVVPKYIISSHKAINRWVSWTFLLCIFVCSFWYFHIFGILKKFWWFLNKFTKFISLSYIAPTMDHQIYFFFFGRWLFWHP
jgi:hypothetical protein